MYRHFWLIILFILSINLCEAGELKIPLGQTFGVAYQYQHLEGKKVTGSTLYQWVDKGDVKVLIERHRDQKGKVYALGLVEFSPSGLMIRSEHKDQREETQVKMTALPKGWNMEVTSRGDWIEQVVQNNNRAVPLPLMGLFFQNQMPRLAKGELESFYLVVPQIMVMIKQQGLPDSWSRIKMKVVIDGIRQVKLGGKKYKALKLRFSPADSLMKGLLPPRHQQVRLVIGMEKPYPILIYGDGTREYQLKSLQTISEDLTKNP